MKMTPGTRRVGIGHVDIDEINDFSGITEKQLAVGRQWATGKDLCCLRVSDRCVAYCLVIL
jgi:hypothetical protein